MTTWHQGGCACGAVRYQVEGEPDICQICHCRYCQRRTGTAFGTVAYFPEDRVTILQGELREYRHHSDETGRWLAMQFCPTCGTTVSHRVEIRPGLRAIAVGTLDDPEWPRIQRHIWVQSRRSWVSIPPGVATLERGAPGSSPTSSDR